MNLVRGTAVALLAAAVICACQSAAFGDGKVFSGRPQPMAVPDQEAILCFRNGVETLAIRTRAEASASAGKSPMAWVVPVPGPGAPRVGSTTDGAFVSADRLLSTRFRDRAADGEGSAALIFGIAAVVSVLLLRAVKGPALSPGLRAVCLTLYFGLFVLIATCLSLPTLARSRGAGEGWVAEGVQALKSDRVGTFDVTVLKAEPNADAAAALREWLRGSGCVVPAEADPVISAYAAEGWVFVAARLTDDAAAGRVQPTPLVLTFDTPKPIYPMRLTGAGNGPIALTLFVLADGTAAAPGMTVEHSDELFAFDEWMSMQQSRGYITHKGFQELFLRAADADGLAWGTRLSGTLTPAQQKQDLSIGVTPGVYSRRQLYTPRAAASASFAVGSLVCGLLLLPLTAWALIRRHKAGWLLTRSTAVVAVAIFVGMVAAKTMPTLPGSMRYTRPADRVSGTLATQIRAAAPGGEAQTRAWIAARRAAGVWPWADLADESDGPGGWILRTDDKGVLWLDAYDDLGRKAESERLFPSAEPSPK